MSRLTVRTFRVSPDACRNCGAGLDRHGKAIPVPRDIPAKQRIILDRYRCDKAMPAFTGVLFFLEKQDMLFQNKNGWSNQPLTSAPPDTHGPYSHCR